jgi:polysaccharide export outer membrane protein
VGGAQAERLAPTRVDDSGEIFVPFAGKLRAGGHTTGELAEMIRRSLKGLSQDPQVVVAISQSITNSVILGGELARPGRLVLSTNRESLADVLALAGGWRGEAKDIAVQITRGRSRIEYRLAEVMAGADHEFRIQPGDRIELLKKPQTFAVLGAAGRVEQLAFSAPVVSLAEALAMSGGAGPNLGDAKAVFVFRLEKGADGKDQPTVYHLNMMNPGNIFLAQRFAMRDKDVLYVGNAEANQPSKLIQLVSQMFSPIMAVESVLVNTGTLP